MDKTTPDLIDEQIEKLKRLFPEVVTEGRIDFERLRETLGDRDALAGDEAYTFSWAGRDAAIRALQTPSAASLQPVPEESVNWEETRHLFIEGENLEVLKLLYKSYFGRVKMIYIDPPYNTGNDFIYRDDYSEPLQAYLEKTGQIDAEGNVLTSNPETRGRYHSDWLTMMYPRLFLARQLLREDGVIFVSIDDNEVHHLRLLMNEIFGEENFVAAFVWQKKYSRDNRPVIGTVHEYLLLFAKSVDKFTEVRGLLPPSEESLKVYRNPNNDPKGRWRPVPMTAQGYRPNQMYPIITPAGVIHYPPEGRCWSMIQPEYEKLLAEGRIYFGKEGDAQPNVIRYLSEIEGFVPWTWWPSDEVGHTDQAKKEIYGLLGRDEAFDTPKPVQLIERVLRIATTADEQAIALDFFSGSGTTAQAVLALNREDDGNRRFLLVQVPEPSDNPEFPTIAEMGKERIRRVIAQMQAEDEGKLDLHPDEDLGFKVFKLAPSTFREWERPEDAAALEAQLSYFDAGLKDDANLTHARYEVLLKEGYSLNARIGDLGLSTNRVDRICQPAAVEEGAASADRCFYLCLDEQIHDATLDALPLDDQTVFICQDTALDDSQKVNLALQCILKTI
jgi:adenine-specific DNA-methyltransferase